MSFILGLVLPICFIAGITGAWIFPQWSLLSILLLPSLWQKGSITSFHWMGAAFIGYAIVSLAWSASPQDSFDGIWYVLVWGLSFRWGSLQGDLTGLWKGLAIGLGINSTVAILQALGYHPVMVNDGFAGLLFQTRTLSAVAGIGILALICHRLWFWIPPVLPGLYLSHARAGWIILGIGMIFRHLHWAIAIPIAATIAGFALYHPNPSDLERIFIWSQTWFQLRLFGWGPGIFTDVVLTKEGAGMIHPGFTHNDFLQLAFEYGIGALLPIGILAGGLSRFSDRNWPILVAMAILAGFWYPFFHPVTAFLGCAVAGHLLRGVDPVCDAVDHRRSQGISFATARGAGAG